MPLWNDSLAWSSYLSWWRTDYHTKACSQRCASDRFQQGRILFEWCIQTNAQWKISSQTGWAASYNGPCSNFRSYTQKANQLDWGVLWKETVPDQFETSFTQNTKIKRDDDLGLKHWQQRYESKRLACPQSQDSKQYSSHNLQAIHGERQSKSGLSKATLINKTGCLKGSKCFQY